MTLMPAPPCPCDRFHVEDLRGSCKDRFWAPIMNWAAGYPQREWWIAPLRWLFPIVRIPIMGVTAVLRDEDVREVLLHDQEFQVPWGERMKAVTGCKNFVLGMPANDEYRHNYAQLAKAFKREDVAEFVVPLSARASEEILRSQAQKDPATGRMRIDAVRELMWRVPSQLCEDYFGIRIPDKFLFAAWTVAMSRYLFGEANDRLAPSQPFIKDLALAAADCFRDLIRAAISDARKGRSPGVVLPRLIEMQRTDPLLTDPVIEAHLFGMVTGFIPTDLLAGGHMLNTLLRCEAYKKRALAALYAGNDDLLWRCLQEALRFRHFNLGPFRLCGPSGYTIAAGTRREKRIAPGTQMLASTQSAMFDSRRVENPKVFNPDRPEDDYMVFGFGQHWCIGKYIAIAQITETFKALLHKQGLKPVRGRAGRLQMYTVYPANLTVEFEP